MWSPMPHGIHEDAATPAPEVVDVSADYDAPVAIPEVRSVVAEGREFEPTVPYLPAHSPPLHLEQRVEQFSLAPFPQGPTGLFTGTGVAEPGSAWNVFSSAPPFLPRLRASVHVTLGDEGSGTVATVLLPDNVQWRDRVQIHQRGQLVDPSGNHVGVASDWQPEGREFVSRVLVQYHDTPVPLLAADTIRSALAHYARERLEDDDVEEWKETEFGLVSTSGEFIPRVILPWHDALLQRPPQDDSNPVPGRGELPTPPAEQSVFPYVRATEADHMQLAEDDTGAATTYHLTPSKVVGLATITSASVEPPAERVKRYVSTCRKRCELPSLRPDFRLPCQASLTNAVYLVPHDEVVQPSGAENTTKLAFCEPLQRPSQRTCSTKELREREMPVELWVYIVMNFVPRLQFGALRLCSAGFNKIVCSLCMFWRMRLPSAAAIQEDCDMLRFLANRCIVHELLDGVTRGECGIVALRQARCLRGCCYGAWRQHQEKHRAQRQAQIARWRELYLCRSILSGVAFPRIEHSTAHRFDDPHAGLRALRDRVVFGTAVMVVALLVCAVLVVAQLFLILFYPALASGVPVWQAWVPTWMAFALSILIYFRFFWCSLSETAWCGGVWLISTQLTIILLITFRWSNNSNNASPQETSFSSCMLPSSLAHPVVAFCGLMRVKDLVALHQPPLKAHDWGLRVVVLIAALVGTAVSFALIPVMVSQDLDHAAERNSFVASGVVWMVGSLCALTTVAGSCHCVGWLRLLDGAPWFFAGVCAACVNLALFATAGAVTATATGATRTSLVGPLACSALVSVLIAAVALVVDANNGAGTAESDSAVKRWIYDEDVEVDFNAYDVREFS